MSYTPKDNTGSIFTNDRKEKDNHPDRQGTAKIDGVEYYISGWIKKTSDNKPWLSLSFKRKENQATGGSGGSAHGAMPARRQISGFDDIDDSIPF